MHAGQRGHVGQSIGYASDPLGVPRGRSGIDADPAFEAGDAGDEGNQRRRRRDDQHRQRMIVRASLEKALAKMQQVAARLDLAGAANVVGFHPRGLERVHAGHHFMVRDDRAELEREHVEGSFELVRGDEQRCRQPGAVPSIHLACARAQVPFVEGFDERQRTQ